MWHMGDGWGWWMDFGSIQMLARKGTDLLHRNDPQPKPGHPWW